MTNQEADAAIRAAVVALNSAFQDSGDLMQAVHTKAEAARQEGLKAGRLEGAPMGADGGDDDYGHYPVWVRAWLADLATLQVAAEKDLSEVYLLRAYERLIARAQQIFRAEPASMLDRLERRKSQAMTQIISERGLHHATFQDATTRDLLDAKKMTATLAVRRRDGGGFVEYTCYSPGSAARALQHASMADHDGASLTLTVTARDGDVYPILRALAQLEER